jgi:hypothetical protein
MRAIVAASVERHRYYAGSLFVLVLLAACAADYEPPAFAPTATLTLRSAAGSGRSALIYDNADCDGARFLTTPDDAQKAVIAAGRQIWLKQSFNTVGLKFGRYCEALVTFVPEPGVDYAVDFTLDAAGCRSHVMQVAESGERPEPSAAAFSNPNCKSW